MLHLVRPKVAEKRTRATAMPGGKQTSSFWVSNADKLPFVQADQNVGLAPIAVVPGVVGATQKRTRLA
jgi:hypothetical protein